MKLKIGKAVLYLGRLGKNGCRNVERIRLADWSALMPGLRRRKLRTNETERFYHHRTRKILPRLKTQLRT